MIVASIWCAWRIWSTCMPVFFSTLATLVLFLVGMFEPTATQRYQQRNTTQNPFKRVVQKLLFKMADKVKTLHRFTAIKQSITPTIQAVTVSKRKKVVLLSNGSEFLYILVEDCVKHTFRFPSSITTVRFQDSDGRRRILAGTEDGHIFAVSLPENLTKSKRLKKSPDPKSDVVEEQAKQMQPDDCDIFGELLAGTSSNVGGIINKQSLIAKCMTFVDVGCAVLFEPGLRTFMTIKGNIVCCRASEKGHVLSVFCPVTMPSGSSTMVYSPLPVLKDMITAGSEVQRSCYQGYVPQLCCVQASGSVSCSSSSSIIERSLFNKLFHCDASLLDAPVVIFGGEDGQIVFWPINSFALANASSKTAAGKQLYSPQLLYHMEQRVAAIYTARLHNEEDSSVCPSTASETGVSSRKHKQESNSYCNALVFLGGCDKIIIVSERKHLSQKSGEEKTMNFTGHTIIGPILCSCMSSRGDILIHSTGKEIFVTKLSLNGELNAVNSAVTLLSSSMLTFLDTVTMQIPNVAVLCCVNKRSKTDGTKTLLYGLTVNGKLLSFSLPELQCGEPSNASNVSPQMAGEKVKSYLHEIETQSAKLVNTNASIENEDRILKELNVIIHTASQLTENVGGSTVVEQDACPLSCSFAPNVVCQGSSGNSSVSLLCKVINQGNFVLSSSCSLMVHIQGKERWHCHAPGLSCTLGCSIPLTSMHPGSVIEVNIPLSKSFSSLFHITVQVHLYCNLNSLLADLRSELESTRFFKIPVEDVVMPISRKVIDVLHFVRPNVMASQVSIHWTVPDSKEELLQTLANFDLTIHHVMYKNILDHDRAKIAEEPTQVRSYSATFFVSQDAIHFMSIAIQNSPALKATLPAEPLVLQATVLYFIFMDSSIPHQQIDMEYYRINLLSVNGDRASIQVKPASGVTRSADGPALEVTLNCSSVRQLCHLHEAVLTRFKPVITNETRKSQMRAHDVQKQLEKLQNLQQKGMWLEDEMSTGKVPRQYKCQVNELKQKLRAFYEELRGVVLVI